MSGRSAKAAAELANSPRKLAIASARIFGNVVRGPNARSPTKYAKRLMKGQNVVEYSKHSPLLDTVVFKHLRALGLYYDEHKTWREQQIVANKARGKVYTKKGEGKRQGKNK